MSRKPPKYQRARFTKAKHRFLRFAEEVRRGKGEGYIFSPENYNDMISGGLIGMPEAQGDIDAAISHGLMERLGDDLYRVTAEGFRYLDRHIPPEDI